MFCASIIRFHDYSIDVLFQIFLHVLMLTVSVENICTGDVRVVVVTEVFSG